jgi:hypothetical protein
MVLKRNLRFLLQMSLKTRNFAFLKQYHTGYRCFVNILVDFYDRHVKFRNATLWLKQWNCLCTELRR